MGEIMQKTKLRLLFSCCIFVYCLAGKVAFAKTIKDVNIPDTITQDGSGLTLKLNGAGIRSKFIFSIYIGALYLPVTKHSATAILQDDVNNRVMMYCLYHEIDKEKLTDAWDEGFTANLNKQQLAKLKNRINEFNGLFPALKQGDIVLLDYIPGKGTSITYNGKLLGNIDGEDFNQALLRIWLGKHPADDSLKTDMLGTE